MCKGYLASKKGLKGLGKGLIRYRLKGNIGLIKKALFALRGLLSSLLGLVMIKPFEIQTT